MMSDTGQSYRNVACAVIEQAVNDAIKPIPAPASKSLDIKKRQERDRRRHVARNQVLSAVMFLTSPNEDLKFWCVVAGLNMTAVIEASKRRLWKQIAGFRSVA
jgi:hypothetical protein